MTADHVDHAISDLARAQHGVFAHRQARTVGATPRMIQTRLANHRWIPLDHHVYALPSHPATWRRQLKAAELRFVGGAISGRAAAVLHGLGEIPPGSIEVTVPRTSGRAGSRLASVRRRDGLPTTTVDGIRVVTAPWALADLAGQAPPAVLERAMDDALVRRLVLPSELLLLREELVARRARGATAFGALVEERANDHVPPTNQLEAALYRLLDRPEFPPYERQARFPWRADAPQRVDAYVPHWRRIVEADGRVWHARYTDFERDKRRDHEAQRHGVEVTRFTWRQLVREPEYALGVLQAIAATRAA